MRGSQRLLNVLMIGVFGLFALSLPANSAPVESARASNRFSKKNNPKLQKNGDEIRSVRAEALHELDSVPASSAQEVPSVMMPLKAEYNPIPRRAWDWLLEIELSQRKLELPRPSDSLGPQNLNVLPSFSFFGLAAGLEKSFSQFRFGVLSHGAIAVAALDSTLPSGSLLKTRYQWIGYGFEPRVTWSFTPHFSVLVGMGFDQVSVIQSSNDSELAQWTRSMNESSRRLALQYSADGHQYISLAARQIENEFEKPQVYSLVWGARW